MNSVEKNRTAETKNKPAMTQDIHSVNREQTATRFAMYRDAIAGMGGIRHEGV